MAADIALEPRMPSLKELGDDLLRVSPGRRMVTLALPFAAMGCYAFFAWMQIWPLAVFSVAALCFVTYGSTSHDLVHRTLRLPNRVNDLLLTLIELLSLRSGTAYRLSHLHHHAHLLAADDLEGSAAQGSWLSALVAGVTMQGRLWLWAWTRHPRARPRLLLEAFGIAALISGALALYPLSAVPLVYAALVIAGSWLFPFVTVYLPHDAHAATALEKTRLFRGWIFRVIALDHLYHFEHHLYPAVPHHHWPVLASRLDCYLGRGLTRVTAIARENESSDKSEHSKVREAEPRNERCHSPRWRIRGGAGLAGLAGAA
jgi:beta-carotene hydroxylase